MRGSTLLSILIAGLFIAWPAIGETASRLEISSDPPGYDAWLNDHYAGKTPLTATVPPGPNVLVLGRATTDSIFSAPAADTLLEVADGETLRVHLVPEEATAVSSRRPPTIVDAPPPISGEKKPLLKGISRYALPVFAAVCIGAGALIEKSADRAYDRYQRSADPGEIRHHYDDARLRDSWSTVLWTAGETSLAVSILSWILPDRDRAHETGEAAR